MSLDEIRVKYRFYNKSHHEIRTIVAFPLPSIPPYSEDEDVANNYITGLDFSTHVNGVPVRTEIEQKTFGTTYFWEQIFPPQAEIRIDHSYVPFSSKSVPLAWSDPDEQDRIKYCMDSHFLQSTVGQLWSEARIAYILTTGINWLGPIGDFKLVVDKGDASNLVSFCATGVTKIGPTQFQVHKRNFEPQDDLFILILQPETD